MTNNAAAASQPLWLKFALAWLRAHGRRFYNFDGLDAFKAKLRPQSWEPLYAVTDRGGITPEVLLAIAGVFTDGTLAATVLRALASALRHESAQLAASARSLV